MNKAGFWLQFQRGFTFVIVFRGFLKWGYPKTILAGWGASRLGNQHLRVCDDHSREIVGIDVNN